MCLAYPQLSCGAAFDIVITRYQFPLPMENWRNAKHWRVRLPANTEFTVQCSTYFLVRKSSTAKHLKFTAFQTKKATLEEANNTAYCDYGIAYFIKH